MLTPRCVVSFTIGDCQVTSIAIPAQASDLVVVVEAGDFVGRLRWEILLRLLVLSCWFVVIPVSKIIILVT